MSRSRKRLPNNMFIIWPAWKPVVSSARLQGHAKAIRPFCCDVFDPAQHIRAEARGAYRMRWRLDALLKRQRLSAGLHLAGRGVHRVHHLHSAHLDRPHMKDSIGIIATAAVDRSGVWS